jgi:hypothetical protein
MPLTEMPMMMQHAIDLTVLSQNVDRFQSRQPSPRLRELCQHGSRTSRQVSERLEEVRKEGISLSDISVDAGQRRPVAEFQYKVLHSLQDGKTKKLSRKKK